MNSIRKFEKNIEKTWPNWKIDLANKELLISKHAKKLKKNSQVVTIHMTKEEYEYWSQLLQSH